MKIIIILDEIACIIFLLCILIYVIALFFGYKKKTPSQFNLLKLIYSNWVDNQLKDDSPIISIQALRNFIMGNSTFASALFILAGILVTFFNTVSNINTKHFFGIEELHLGLVQVTINVIVIIFCLFNFILSIRYVTRLSIVISGHPQDYKIGNLTGVDLARKTLLLAQNHWMYGVRASLYLIATLLWLINAIFFIIISIIVTIYLIAFQDVWTNVKSK